MKIEKVNFHEYVFKFEHGEAKYLQVLADDLGLEVGDLRKVLHEIFGRGLIELKEDIADR